MVKRPPRARRGRATASPPLAPAPSENRGLLARILDTPHLAHVVPQLSPDVLHRVIDRCGLEDCGEIVALATPDQLVGVFDLDLWRAERPGLDERFDADRFGVWLEVLVECGDAVAAQTLASMDADLVVAALAQHVRVFDQAAGIRLPGSALTQNVGGYVVADRHATSWDAIVGVLLALDAHHQDAFHRVMQGCRSLSNSAPEIDGLDDLLAADGQAMFDLAVDRERRREQQGYTTPAEARAFLQMARQPQTGRDAAPPGNPVARAYFRTIDWSAPLDTDDAARRLAAETSAPPAPEDVPIAVADLAGILLDAGVLAPAPRALLGGSQDDAPRLARIRTLLQAAHDREPAAYMTRTQELAYLANTILAGSGCSIQARPFTLQEASEAAVAVCNLGLEAWPVEGPGAALPDDFLVAHDLVSVFETGWALLYQDVSMYTAEQLIAILAELRCGDREIQAGLNALRVAMRKSWKNGTPWSARDALEVITSLDMPAWAVLLGLTGELPVIHAGLAAARGSGARAVSATAFEFIAERSQIAAVRAYLRTLPEVLRA